MLGKAKKFCLNSGKKILAGAKTGSSYLWGKISIYWKLLLETVVVLAIIYFVAKTYNQAAGEINWSDIRNPIIWGTVGVVILFGSYKLWERLNDSGVPESIKSWKFWRWPVRIAVGLLIIFFGIPWVWQKATPVFDNVIAFGERRNSSYSCKAEEERSSVNYTKIAQADAPTVDTIPSGWNLQKWTEEDKLERELSRSGPLLIETNRVKSGVDSVHIAFRLHKIVC